MRSPMKALAVIARRAVAEDRSCHSYLNVLIEELRLYCAFAAGKIRPAFVLTSLKASFIEILQTDFTPSVVGFAFIISHVVENRITVFK
ncbi:hypothetical protein L1049_014870 [Liquidambar formosana]|uniref:Uncharacterized protein n=1 Tax=Liquidambar formosana TaxID=63359 RepID=A0AAP0RWR0_LIQFO